MIKKIFKSFIDYIKDWKNLLTHTIIGVGILLVALLLPINIHFRIGILLVVVAFNVIRMRLEKKKEKTTQ
jgi:hypothetical protein